ncbi:MAG: hypothetical protein GWO24_07825 [Akkermansiaceae bacterium]|nr:hypothetical protein [Akkermansiaceae bacterium]
MSENEADRMLRGEVDSFAGGIVRVGGVPTKYWMREEILGLVREHGLAPQRVRRVQYGWKEEIDDPPRWLRGPFPWDWLVVCGRVEAG